jgi:hypothetical protein
LALETNRKMIITTENMWPKSSTAY